MRERDRPAVDIEVARDDVARRRLEVGAVAEEVRRQVLRLPRGGPRCRRARPRGRPTARAAAPSPRRARSDRRSSADGSAGVCRKLTSAPLASAMRRAISFVWNRTSDLVEAGDRRDETDAAQRREPADCGDLPDRRAPRDGEGVAGLEARAARSRPRRGRRAPAARRAGGVGTTTARRSPSAASSSRASPKRRRAAGSRSGRCPGPAPSAASGRPSSARPRDARRSRAGRAGPGSRAPRRRADPLSLRVVSAVLGEFVRHSFP